MLLSSLAFILNCLFVVFLSFALFVFLLGKRAESISLYLQQIPLILKMLLFVHIGVSYVDDVVLLLLSMHDIGR